MKVTICSYDGIGYFGGPYEWIKSLGFALQHEQVTVDFLFLSANEPEKGETFKYMANAGFKCRGLKVNTLLKYNDNTEYKVKWLLKAVKEYPTDIFITNNVIEACFAAKWIREAGIPTIGIMHSDGDRAFWLTDEFVSYQPGFELSGLVSVSQYIHDKISKLPHAKTQLTAIPCGAKFLDYKAEYQLPIRIMYAGKLAEEAKRITALAEAFCNVVNQVDQVEAYIYGDGHAREKVLNIINAKGNGRVHYGGFVNHDEIQKVISQGQIIVLLSDYEGLPVILLEGMACGVVPVCLSIPSGIPELIDNGVNGFLVKNREEDFVEAIRKLRNDATLWKAMSEKSVSKVYKDYSIEATSRKWISFIHALQKETSGYTSIKIPSRIELPKVNKWLLQNDRRRKSFGAYLKAQIKRVLNRF